MAPSPDPVTTIPLRPGVTGPVSFTLSPFLNFMILCNAVMGPIACSNDIQYLHGRCDLLTIGSVATSSLFDLARKDIRYLRVGIRYAYVTWYASY